MRFYRSTKTKFFNSLEEAKADKEFINSIKNDRHIKEESLQDFKNTIFFTAKIAKNTTLVYGENNTHFLPSDHLFNVKSMSTLKDLPITNGHPEDFVNVFDDDKFIGRLYETGGRVEGKYIVASGMIYDKEAIEEIKAGKVELSLGYHSELVEEKGTYRDVPYNYIQTKIDYNHLALVDAGRNGADVSLDASIMENDMSKKSTKDKEEIKEELKEEKKTTTINSEEDKEEKKTEPAKDKEETEEGKNSENEDKEEKEEKDDKTDYKEKYNSLKKELKALQSKYENEAERQGLLNSLTPEAQSKFKDSDIIDIKKFIINEKLGDVDFKGKSAEVINGMYLTIDAVKTTKAGATFERELKNDVKTEDDIEQLINKARDGKLI